MNSIVEYKDLKNKLYINNIYTHKGIEFIDNHLLNNDFTIEQALFHLKELERNQDYIPELPQFDWKELIKVIDYSEKRLKRTTRLQFYIALLELPLVIIGLLLAIGFKLFGEDPITTLTAAAGILAALSYHTFLILRLHQQTTSAIERLIEKKVGIFFLRMSADDLKGKIDVEKFINAGTQMFLGHHVKPAEPLSPADSPINNKKDED